MSAARLQKRLIEESPVIRQSYPAYGSLNRAICFIVNERRGRINSGQTARALHLLSSLPVETDMSIDEESLMRLARMRQLTVYDAAYLELSLRRNIALATLDAKLAAAGRAEAVLLIGEER